MGVTRFVIGAAVFAGTVNGQWGFGGFGGGGGNLNPSNALKSTYTGPLGLNDAASKAGKYMGTASDMYFQGSASNDGPYMNEFKNGHDWGMVTPGNLMKMAYIHPQPQQYDFSKADQFISMARNMGYAVRCHALVWHTQAPSWLENGHLSNESMLAALTDHITTIMTHFKDNCYAWDVVNEAVQDDGSYRQNFFYQSTGPAYIAHAFNVAARVKKSLGLKVKLYYNDYNVEFASNKTIFMYNMVGTLLRQGVEIDGVGLQGHLIVGQSPTKAQFMDVIQAFTKLGCDVAITELDIRTSNPNSEAVQKQQNLDYYAIIGACKAVPKCVGATLWDFDDTYSWLASGHVGEGYALPFYQPGGAGSQLVRKIAYDGILAGWTN